jgi:hypothetical protein
VSTTNSDTFLALAEILAAGGWAIVKFEDLGSGVTLTLVPRQGTEGAGA